MPQLLVRAFVRVCLLTASMSLSVSPVVFADVLDPTSAVPPPNSFYSIPNTCISVVCVQNIHLTDFNTISHVLSGGNELTVSNVDLTANLYQNVGGMAGMFISPIILTGQVDITYFSKPSLLGTGDFSTQLTSLDLSGSFTGLTGHHTLDAILNPSQMSTGETSIEQISSGPDVFQISSFFDVFTELSIDGGPFVPGPERVATLEATPEPGYYFPIGIGIAFAAVRRARVARRRRIAVRSAVS